MKRSYIQGCVACVTALCLGLGAPVRAGEIEDVQTLKLGLEDTIQRALAASEQVKISENTVDKARGVYHEARSGLLPLVSAQSSWTSNTDYPSVGTTDDNELLMSGTVSQVLWSFGKVMHAVTAAKRAAEAEGFTRDASTEQVIYNAKLVYFSARLAYNTLTVTEQSYVNTVENKNILTSRSFGGRSSKHELLKMDADVAARVPTVNEARAQCVLARDAVLRIMVDADPDAAIELTDDFKDTYEPVDFYRLVAEMNENEPSLKSLNERIRAAEKTVASARAGFLPTISGFASIKNESSTVSDASPDRNDLDRYEEVGAKVTVPIFEGGLKAAKLRQAEADKRNAMLLKKQAEKTLLTELKKASLEYEQYTQNLAANTEAVRLAGESFKQMRDMFSSGLVTLTDLNDAELLLTNQMINKQVTLYNINVTLAKIEQLTMGEYDGYHE